jgi:hypothetical protein
VKRIVLVIVALAAFAPIAAGAYVRGLLPGTNRCVLRSVDRREYVAGNEALFRTIPLPRYLREAYSNTWTHAIPAHNQCLPLENGRPYSAYITTRVYVGPRLGFDEKILRGRWVRAAAGDVNTSTFRRGEASLAVTTTDESVLLTVDYRSYARRSR